MKKLEKVIFFIPRLLISGAVIAKNSTDKKDLILILGMSSFFYGAYILFPSLAFIMIGLLLLKLSGL